MKIPAVRLNCISLERNPPHAAHAGFWTYLLHFKKSRKSIAGDGSACRCSQAGVSLSIGRVSLLIGSASLLVDNVSLRIGSVSLSIGDV